MQLQDSLFKSSLKLALLKVYKIDLREMRINADDDNFHDANDYDIGDNYISLSMLFVTKPNAAVSTKAIKTIAVY